MAAASILAHLALLAHHEPTHVPVHMSAIDSHHTAFKAYQRGRPEGRGNERV